MVNRLTLSGHVPDIAWGRRFEYRNALISTTLLLPNQSNVVHNHINALNEFAFSKRRHTINEPFEPSPARYSKRACKAAAYHWVAGTFIAIARRVSCAFNPPHRHTRELEI